MKKEKNGRLLLIDDDVEFCLLARDYMELQNIILEYRVTGENGLEALEKKRWKLILPDTRFPDIPGVEVLRRIRMKSGVPVIVFSAHNDETDRIVTLELGADDDVSKSFSSRELLARVRAVLYRSAGNAGGDASGSRSAYAAGFLPRQAHRADLCGISVPWRQRKLRILYGKEQSNAKRSARRAICFCNEKRAMAKTITLTFFLVPKKRLELLLPNGN